VHVASYDHCATGSKWLQAVPRVLQQGLTIAS